MPDPADQEFVITRVFDAPRDLVWKALTESERLMHWWGPKGFTMLTSARWIFAPAASSTTQCEPQRSTRCGANGSIVKSFRPSGWSSSIPSRMQAGNIVRAPFNAAWPLEVLNVVTFSELTGKTTITIRGGPRTRPKRSARRSTPRASRWQQGFTGHVRTNSTLTWRVSAREAAHERRIVDHSRIPRVDLPYGRWHLSP